jgi:hypothetical protein
MLPFPKRKSLFRFSWLQKMSYPDIANRHPAAKGENVANRMPNAAAAFLTRLGSIAIAHLWAEALAIQDCRNGC